MGAPLRPRRVIGEHLGKHAVEHFLLERRRHHAPGFGLDLNPAGSFILRPGAWAGVVQSYCLKAGTHGPGGGDASPRAGATCEDAPASTVRHGGWVALCRTDTERLSYLQHRFTEAYRAYVNRGDLQNWPRKLTGDRSPDEVYLSRGLPPPKPVLIGDAARAQQVLASGSANGRLAISSMADALGGAVALIGTPAEDAA